MTSPARSLTSPNLDLLRTTAVLCVFLNHLLLVLGFEGAAGLGRFGVLLFFVHTSLVLMLSLDRLELHAQSDTRLMLAFWIRRLFRIYPLAILFVLLTVIFPIPRFPTVPYTVIGFRDFLSNIALIQNLTGSDYRLVVFWTLPIELQMYAMLPFIYLLLRGTRYRAIVLWIISVILALTVSPGGSSRLKVFAFAPCFLSGVVAYDLVRSKILSARLPAWAWPVGIFLSIALSRPFDSGTLSSRLPRGWVLCLALGLLYPTVYEVSYGRLQLALHWIAEHSYGIYLCHPVFLWIAIIRMHNAPWPARALVLLFGITAVPAALYVLIEKPLIVAGARIAGHLLKTPAESKARQLA
jgi:peptidoglycan/LPS O-acetylase OafA/YrhL